MRVLHDSASYCASSSLALKACCVTNATHTTLQCHYVVEIKFNASA